MFYLKLPISHRKTQNGKDAFNFIWFEVAEEIYTKLRERGFINPFGIWIQNPFYFEVFCQEYYYYAKSNSSI